MAAVLPDEPKFLCRPCRSLMCEDCKSIAAEYEFLHDRRKAELFTAQKRVEELAAEVKRLERQRAEWERMAKLGLNDIIRAWMDSVIKTGS